MDILVIKKQTTYLKLILKAKLKDASLQEIMKDNSDSAQFFEFVAHNYHLSCSIIHC